MDLYQILGLEKTASKKQIKAAYRSLAKKHHPDKGGDVEKFKMVAKAHEILSDDEKRCRYDNGESDSIDDIVTMINTRMAELFSMTVKDRRFSVEQTDIVKHITDSVDRATNQVDISITEAEAEISKLTRVKDRIEIIDDEEDDEDNIFMNSLNTMIQDQKNIIKKLDMELDCIDGIKKKLKSFRYNCEEVNFI